uniref:SAM domain-containing protein n=1 Tax=Steinernema glaseri TaxID=37863 RepID=A0A1I7YLE2_9BILA
MADSPMALTVASVSHANLRPVSVLLNDFQVCCESPEALTQWEGADWSELGALFGRTELRALRQHIHVEGCMHAACVILSLRFP